MHKCKVTVLLFSFALLCTLAACTAQSGSGQAPESESSGAAGGASSAGGLPLQPLRLCDTQTAGGYYLGEDSGPYGNITYIDYESHRQVYLCARPECAHDSDVCTSVVTGSVLFYVVNDHIYLIRVRTDEYGPPELFSMASDGSDRRSLVQFPANYQFSQECYTDETFLYFSVDAVSEDRAEAQRHLIRVNPADGFVETLYTFPPEYMTSFIAGTAGRRLIIAFVEKNPAQDGWSVTYRFLDVDTRAFAEEESIPIDSSHGSVWYGGRLHEILYEKDAVCITDPAAGTVSEISYAPVFTMPGNPAFRHDIVGEFEVTDGILGLQLYPKDGSDEKTYVFHLYPESGEIVPFTLYQTYKPEPITVLAKQGGLLLVIVDWKKSQGADPMSYNFTPQYALIKEADYLANNPAYIPVQSDFYPDAWA